MEIDGRHEYHPPAQPDHRSSKPARVSERVSPRVARPVSQRLGARALDRPVGHHHAALLARPLPPPEGHPADLLQQEEAPQHEQEHVAADVVPAAPLAPGGLARDRTEDVGRAGVALLDGDLHDLAFPAGIPKPAVDDRGPEEPLRHEDPPERDETPPDRRPDLVLELRGRRVREEEGEEGHGDPRPAALDEQRIEDVVLASEIRRRESRVLDVGLRDVVVRCRARLGREEREERAEDEERRVRGEDEAFGGGREVRCAPRFRGRCARRLRGRRAVGSGGSHLGRTQSSFGSCRSRR